ncbi:MAG: hypothetical protein M9955_20195 [Rhizobiaceae bacterium]|nr:hypothetical protein [Rhizobiaceae bacterium]
MNEQDETLSKRLALAYGEEWSLFVSEDPAWPGAQALGMLIFPSGDGIAVLGHAPIIATSGPFAVCFAAAHSVDAIQLDQQRQKGWSEFNLSPDFRSRKTRVIDVSKSVCFFDVGGSAQTAMLVGMHYVENFDIAAVGVSVIGDARLPQHRLALDLTPPEVGETVFALVNEIASVDVSTSERLETEITLKSHCRVGKVTAVHASGPLPGQTMTFRTTIPVTPGMSGAPICRLPETASGKLAICGIVSSDISAPEAFVDRRIAGNSTATMIWPSMGLRLPFRLDDAPALASLGVGLQLGAFDDRTKAGTLTVEESAEVTRVTYIDQRRVRPRVWTYEFTGEGRFLRE